MRNAFPESFVDGHETLIVMLQLPDPDDRHVLATAIRADAQHIVTENLIDFPDDKLKPFSVEAISADEFLYRTDELCPTEGTSALRRTRTAYRNPTMSPNEFILDMMRVGLVKTAGLARANIDLI